MLSEKNSEPHTLLWDVVNLVQGQLALGLLSRQTGLCSDEKAFIGPAGAVVVPQSPSKGRRMQLLLFPILLLLVPPLA